MNTQAVMSASTVRAPPIFMLGMLSALGLFATNIYLPSLPAIADALHTTTSGAQTTVTVFMLTFAVAQLLFGPITDRYGRRRVLVAGLFIYSAASIAGMLATDIQSLIVARCVQAVGACSAAVIARAIVRDVFDGLAIFRAMAVVSAFMAIAPGLMPAIGGLLQDTFGWRANFAFVSMLGVILIVWAIVSLRETTRETTASLSLRSAMQSYFELIGSWRFFAPALLGGLPFGGVVAYFAGGPIVFIEHLGLAPWQYGLVPAFGATGVALGSITVNRMTGRASTQSMFAIGATFLFSGALAMLLLALSGYFTVITIVVAATVYLYGMGILIPAGTSEAMRHVAPVMAGRASAMTGFLQMLMGALGAFVVSVLPHLPLLGFPLVMMGMGATAVVVLFAYRPRQQQVVRIDARDRLTFDIPPRL